MTRMIAYLLLVLWSNADILIHLYVSMTTHMKEYTVVIPPSLIINYIMASLISCIIIRTVCLTMPKLISTLTTHITGWARA
jgi:hypothetical protein